MDRNARKIRYVAPDVVALRKESVDRNTGSYHPHFHVVLSLSARRAWIEMEVTRNSDTGTYRRSPQGERG